MPPKHPDIVVIGAGPTGLSAPTTSAPTMILGDKVHRRDREPWIYS